MEQFWSLCPLGTTSVRGSPTCQKPFAGNREPQLFVETHVLAVGSDAAVPPSPWSRRRAPGKWVWRAAPGLSWVHCCTVKSDCCWNCLAQGGMERRKASPRAVWRCFSPGEKPGGRADRRVPGGRVLQRPRHLATDWVLLDLLGLLPLRTLQVFTDRLALLSAWPLWVVTEQACADGGLSVPRLLGPGTGRIGVRKRMALVLLREF